MTLSELQKEAAHLGFEKQIDDSEALLTAVSLALGMIYTDRPVIKTARLCARPITPITRVEKIDFQGGEEVTLPLLGSSWSLRVCGKGSFRVTDAGEARTYTFDTSSSTFKGLLSGEGSITFFGDLSYTVFSLVSFKESYNSKEDVPDSIGTRVFDMKALLSDFGGFVSLPFDTHGKSINAASLREDTLLLPWDFCGEFAISYRVCPESRALLTSAKNIELPSECEHLLPILTAAFLWLDDDSEKAQYYMSLYKSSMASILHYTTKGIDAEYKTVDGWA